jgi:hypothetical protein
MTLTSFDYLNGILFSIFVFLSLAVGIKILSQYFKSKKVIFIKVGITWSLMAAPWFPSVIAFFNALVLDFSPGLSRELYFLIGNIFIPIPLILWVSALTELIYEKYKNPILIALISLTILFYVIFFIQLYLDPSLIGILVGDIDVKYNSISFIGFTYMIILVMFIITGLKFAQQTINSERKDIRIKSQFLIAAFFLFVLGAALDAIIIKTWITLLLMRTLEISSALCFYFGFILPNWLKKKIM